MLINAGVDLGYSYVKGNSKLYERKFDAYIKQISEKEAKQIQLKINDVNEHSLLLKNNNQYYIIGSLAIKYYPTLSKSIAKNRDNDTVMALYLASMGLLNESLDFEMNIAVGTPNRSRSEKDKLEQLLKGTYNFSYLTKDGEVNKNIIIRQTFAMPQPVACAYSLSKEDREDYNIIVIDVGHGTTDTMYLSAGVIASNEAGLRYNTRGIEHCYKLLRDALLDSDICQSHGISTLSERQLQNIIETGKYFIFKEEQDIKQIYEKCLTEYADSLFNDIISNYHVLSQTDVILASGGIFSNAFFTKYLARKFKENYDVMFVTEKGSPQMTVSRGLLNFANENFDDDYSIDNGGEIE